MRRCIYCKGEEGTAQQCVSADGHFFTSAPAEITPVTKDHIVISLSPGYSAVTFKLANGGAECVILDRDATETTRFAIAPPSTGKLLEVKVLDSGVEIIYRAKQ